MTFDRSYRSMWRMKRNMHFKGEFPLPNFSSREFTGHVGGRKSHRQDDCYGLAIFMAAKPVSYAVMCVIFLADPTMPICESHFEFTWFFMIESILTKSTDVYQLISSCLWRCQTHIFMFTNIKHDICSTRHIKYRTMYVQFATRNPPPLKPWSVGQVSSSNWSWHWINLKPGHR